MGGRNYEYWKEHFEDYIDENNKFINNKDSVTEYNKKNNTKMLQYKNIYEEDEDNKEDLLRELIDDIIDNNFNTYEELEKALHVESTKLWINFLNERLH